MKLEVGKIYNIVHSRKGAFTAKITDQCDTWTTGEVVDGETRAMLEYNVKEKGDSVTFRSKWIREAVLVQ